MIYQVQTEVLDGDMVLNKNVDFVGEQPCGFRTAMDAYVNTIGTYNEPNVRCRDINNFVSEYDIKDWLYSTSTGEVDEIELTVRVTVNERLTLD